MHSTCYVLVCECIFSKPPLEKYSLISSLKLPRTRELQYLLLVVSGELGVV